MTQLQTRLHELSGLELMTCDRRRRRAAARLRHDPRHRADASSRRAGRRSRWMPGPEHLNPLGVVHGGILSTLLDSAMGCAVHTTLAAGETYTTLGLDVKFVRPVRRRPRARDEPRRP